MFRKNLSGSKNIENKTISSDDILGKEVFDAEGSSVGIVDIIHIDPIKLDFVGISVDEGFMRQGLVIGKGYIRRITKHAVFLNVMPAFATRGMLVFDKKGRYIGKVKDVVLWQNRNVIQQLFISNGLFKTQSISGDLIATVGQNILLKISREELTKNLKAIELSRQNQ